MKLSGLQNSFNVNCQPLKKVANINNLPAIDTVVFTGVLTQKALSKLSRSVSEKIPQKQFTIVSLPKGLEIVNDTFSLSEKVPTAAIVDIFSDFGNIKLGSNIKAPHGKVVSKYLLEGIEDKAGVLAFDLTAPKGGSQHQAMQDALEVLGDIQKRFKNISVLNLSVGQNYKYTVLNEKLGLRVDSSNVEQQKDVILNALASSQDRYLQNAYKSILAINELVDNGVEVFSASGNLAQDGMDLLSLSKVQHIISADDYKKACTTFATDAAKGRHMFVKEYNEAGKLTRVSDGKITFMPDELEIKNSAEGFLQRTLGKKHVIEGTSYACPIKANEYLRGSI